MKLSTFVNRLKRIGIYIEMRANYPWIYLTRVDDHWIKEKRDSDWGFVLGREVEDITIQYNRDRLINELGI